jgi:hypothetical protein
MSAPGTYVFPLFIYTRMRMAESLKRDGPTGRIYVCFKNVWKADQVSLVDIRYFVAATKDFPTNPILVILHNHVNHISLPIYI